MSRNVSTIAVANKVEWEGGVIEALEWFFSDDLEDPMLRAMWSTAEALWATLRPVVSKIESYLEDALDEG